MKKTIQKAAAFLLSVAMAASLVSCSAKQEAQSIPLSAACTVHTDASSPDESCLISDTLYGLFLEDINFAVDGGLYAELIKNRSFEYGTAAANENRHGWVNENKDYLSFGIADGSTNGSFLNENNPHYAILSYNGLSSADFYYGIGNVGYLDGLAVTKGENYKISLYLKNTTEADLQVFEKEENFIGIAGSYEGMVRISLRDTDGAVYAESFVEGVTDNWRKFETTLTPNASVNKNLRLYVEIGVGSVCMDMISMMPEDTYQGLPVRKDIGEYMEALNPSFLRFPGGCVIEGKDKESIYNWKDSVGNGLIFTVNEEETVGDPAARPQGKDIWSGTKQDPYYTTYGIGFYEYFALCEALDCLPVPVLNAGMTCQVQSPKYTVYPLRSEEFKQCLQDALDLAEFCRGDETTKWGAVRIAMGHEEPFRLKYIAIGNEQWQSEYHAHYEKFVEAFETAAKENPALYGDIELIVANGTASGSTEGWSYLEDCPDNITTLVDEHYYESPDWFLSNTKRYDAYDRTTQAKVFLGEYAAQSNTLQAALAEAAYMTGLERNADIVAMACYAPLFGNKKTNQWTPDMMFFSNDSLYGTVDYYVQKMFANNVGTMILPTELTLTGNEVYTDDKNGNNDTKEAAESIYETTSIDENGDMILKFVNVTETEIPISITLDAVNMADFSSAATVTVLKGDNLSDMNSFEEPEKLRPTEESMEVSKEFTYTAPKYSVSIIRISKK